MNDDPTDRPDDAPADQPGADAPPDPTLYEALPGLARIGLRAGFRTLAWMANETLSTGEEIVGAVAEGESPIPVVREAGHEAWTMVTRSLGLEDADADPAAGRTARRGSERPATTEELRAKGADLLHRSADVRLDDDTHPAFAHILDELSPDEARMLRFLCIEGPQPSVDVRTNRPFGVGSELVVGGLSMIGIQAGVRHPDRTQSYLNNLERLGLIWFSRETVEPGRYQVVEVQPEVVEALKRAGRAPRTVRRSIHLTPFGDDFCATCLPTEAGPPGQAPLP